MQRMSDDLKLRLQNLKLMKPGMHDHPAYFGQWLIEMAELQLDIARSLTEILPEAQK